MSVPFSNTHLRVPRGFGTILEGLAREVLRDQPEDIPKYAAHYFEALLKRREESGMDPAEWAAKLEDRFYNNHAFKTTGATPEKEPTAEINISKENSYESQTEDESSHSADASNLSTTHLNVSEDVDVTESTEEEKEYNITEERDISKEEESVNRLADVQSDELSETDVNNSTTNTLDNVDRIANEKESSSVTDQDVPKSELESTDLLSFSSNVDVCAQELGIAEEEGGDKQETAAVDNKIVKSEGEENIEVEEPEEVFPYSGLADVDICATELGGIERTTAIEEGSFEPQPEETLVKSSLSQFETLEGNHQEAKDQTGKTKEERTETEASSGESHEGLAHIEAGSDGNVMPNENSLVEINFEDVPEAQQITEVGEKQPEGEEGSHEVFQTEMLESPQEEESKEVTTTASQQNISATQHHEPDEPEMEEVENEFNSEEKQMENQQETPDKTNTINTNDSNINGSDDDEKGESVKHISSSHQPTTKADEENPETKTDCTGEDNKEIRELGQNEDSEKETKSNDPDFKEDETTDPVGGDKEDRHTQGYSEMDDEHANDAGVENHSSQVTQSNQSVAAMEAESEILEEREQHLSEESPGTFIEPQPEETVEGKEVTSREEEVLAEGEIDSEVQKKSDATCEGESVSLTQSTDGTAADLQGEERPRGAEEDATEPEGKSSNKEECSRPQEEEDIMDIPLDDPEANRAAAKIQAGFRGHMTRKKMKPEDKAEGEEVSSTGDVLNGSQGDTETGGSGAVERDDTSVPEQ